ncbi:MAG: DUF3078 domain-containing protein, partial [Bacteroidota bacterium]
LTFALLIALSANAQDAAADTAWKKGGIVSVTFNNTALSDNWQGGGIDTRAISSLVNLYAHYNLGKQSWNNNLDLAFGVINQGELSDSRTRKGDDRIDFTSKYGYNFTDKVALAALLNFRTQFAPGFEFDADGAPIGEAISRTFNPAYLNFGAGIDFKPNENLSVYYSPINSKITIVTDEALRTRYMPEEFADQAYRYELGSYLNIRYQKAIWDNLTYQTKADFFLNYLQNPLAVDVNWENLLSLQATEWLGVTFFTHMIYDKDIQVDGAEVGIQFKHVLGIGLTTSFGDKL